MLSVPLEVIGTDSILDLHAGDGDVAIRYATGRAAPTDGIVEPPAVELRQPEVVVGIDVLRIDRDRAGEALGCAGVVAWQLNAATRRPDPADALRGD